jgi:hypothetical protein
MPDYCDVRSSIRFEVPPAQPTSKMGGVLSYIFCSGRLLLTGSISCSPALLISRFGSATRKFVFHFFLLTSSPATEGKSSRVMTTGISLSIAITPERKRRGGGQAPGRCNGSPTGSTSDPKFTMPFAVPQIQTPVCVGWWRLSLIILAGRCGRRHCSARSARHIASLSLPGLADRLPRTLRILASEF